MKPKQKNRERLSLRLWSYHPKTAEKTSFLKPESVRKLSATVARLPAFFTAHWFENRVLHANWLKRIVSIRYEQRSCRGRDAPGVLHHKRTNPFDSDQRKRAHPPLMSASDRFPKSNLNDAWCYRDAFELLPALSQRWRATVLCPTPTKSLAAIGQSGACNSDVLNQMNVCAQLGNSHHNRSVLKGRWVDVFGGKQ